MGWVGALSVVVRDAGITLLACAAVGLLVNFTRPIDGIPLLQKSEYQILVPCPESSGEAPALAAEAPEIRDPRTLLVDARTSADHAKGSWPGVNLPFDYLDPAPPAQVKKIASSGAARVVVFGDGGDPDSGEQLARELAGAGIRNIFFVAGGAPALERVAGGGPR